MYYYQKFTVLFIFFLFIFGVLKAQITTIFNPVKVDDNEFTYSTKCIEQDKYGFIWFGCQNGLYKYDGYNLTQYASKYGSNKHIQSNEIWTMYKDSQGILWIGTFGGGLSRYNYKTDDFTSYLHNDSSDNSLNNNYINVITGDKNGNIWIGMKQGGLDKFNPKTKTFTHFQHEEDNNKSITSNSIISLHVDKRNNLWVGTWDRGLNRLDLNNINNGFQHYLFDNDSNTNIRENRITDIFEDKWGRIWLARGIPGIKLYNLNLDIYEEFSPVCNDSGFYEGQLSSMMQYNKNELWLSTSNGIGILKFSGNRIIECENHYYSPNHLPNKLTTRSPNLFSDKNRNIWLYSRSGVFRARKLIFPHFQITPDPYNKNMVNNIVSFVQSPDDKVWLATWGQGLWAFEQDTKHCYPVNTPEIKDEKIRKLYRATNGKYIICVQDNGFYLYDNQNNIIKHYLDYQDEAFSNYHLNVNDIIEQEPNKYWLATGNGLIHFDAKKDEFNIHMASTSGKEYEINNYFTTLLIDSKDRLWLGTLQGGLYQLVFDRNTELNIKKYSHQINTIGSLSNNSVTCIFEDSDENLWVGTKRGGINKMIKNQDSVFFKAYTEKDGLPSNSISSIREDSHGYLWISSENGLTRFHMKTGSIHNYTQFDGLQKKEFGINTSLKLSDGSMLFGGSNGFNYFHPDNIKPDINTKTVTITGFRLFDKIINVGEKSDNANIILPETISRLDKIILTYLENSFTLVFSTLDYSVPEQVKYAYMLEGYDKAFRYSEPGQNEVTYSNVSAGNYIFNVKSINTDGNWDTETTNIKIIITPPFWKTKMAILLYLFIILALAFLIRQMINVRIAFKHNLEIEKILREKDNKNNKMKLQFFTNISHEFRTPLTLIYAPVEKLLKEIKDPSQLNQLITIQSNTKKLLNLIKQLMDFRKIDAGKLRVNLSKTELVSYIRDIYHSFILLAEQRNINYYYNTDFKQEVAFIDKDKINIVMYNLLSNAFKACKEGDTISMQLKIIPAEEIPDIIQIDRNKYLHYFRISVSDTGTGMSGDQLDKIFERFFQVENSNYTGTGIGLAIVKEYITLMQGGISVKSKLNEGTVFLIFLPVTKTHTIITTETGSVSDNSKDFFSQFDSLSSPTPTIKESEISHQKTSPIKKYTILIVEDNIDLRKYLHKNISDIYQILEAEDGEAGFNLAHNDLPDLIVSDVMMPIMNGIELCRKLKSEFNTCHIPVVLLTALSDIEDQIIGHESGADAYIPKPFSFSYLKAVISNILENREKLKAKFSTDISISAKDISYTDKDQEFIEKATKVVNENIDNSDYDIDQFASHFSLSRSHLFRKLKAITNQSPVEFIRVIRLKTAARSLLMNKNTISEVAYKTGFTSPSYFTHCFKKHFGVSPKEFIDKNKNDGSYNP